MDTTTADGQQLYQAAVDRFAIPPDHHAVPTLIIDQIVLVGSGDIPAQFPALIQQYLAKGGADWPDVPGLAAVVSQNVTSAASSSSLQSNNKVNAPVNDTIGSTETTTNDLISTFQRDPVGNSFAIVVLGGMLVAIGFALRHMQQAWSKKMKLVLFSSGLTGWRSWIMIALCLIGVGVSISIYMTYVETTHTTAVCGPVGDCNTVHQSAYAMLFGLIPIGVLGIIGYMAMLIAHIATRWSRGQFRTVLESSLLTMALFGTLFSVYLTFLEPFVIGATCAWCLTSAVSMMLILVILIDAKPSYHTIARSRP